MKYVLSLFIIIFSFQAKAEFDEQLYSKTCEGTASVVLVANFPDTGKLDKDTLRNHVSQACKGTRSRLDDKSKSYGAKTVGCYDGIQVALLRIEDVKERDSKSMTIFKEYCQK